MIVVYCLLKTSKRILFNFTNGPFDIIFITGEFFRSATFNVRAALVSQGSGRNNIRYYIMDDQTSTSTTSFQMGTKHLLK